MTCSHYLIFISWIRPYIRWPWAFSTRKTLKCVHNMSLLPGSCVMRLWVSPATGSVGRRALSANICGIMNSLEFTQCACVCAHARTRQSATTLLLKLITHCIHDYNLNLSQLFTQALNKLHSHY